MSHSADEKLGLWLIGAHGGLASTIIAGARLIARGEAPRTGLLSESAPFAELPLPPLSGLVFGGHEIRRASLRQSLAELRAAIPAFDAATVERLGPELDLIDQEIVTGTALNCGRAVRQLGRPRKGASGGHPAAVVEQAREALRSFRARHHLDQVIVVNLASTEQPLAERPEHHTAEGITRLVDGGVRAALRASTLYALAAISEGLPFINFTPSPGALLPGLVALAIERGVPVMGNDGKTGETLVKSALAPMFRMRRFQVLSWQGYNILGDRDGQVLADERHKRAKVASKDGVLAPILGHALHTHVGIDFVPSLGDLKTAWDFIHFAGFLDHRMSMQFIWQGCDAVLAAPLVLDMARLAAFAQRRGEHGPMPQLALFFKSPIAAPGHELHVQFAALEAYARERLRPAGRPPRARTAAAPRRGRRPAR